MMRQYAAVLVEGGISMRGAVLAMLSTLLVAGCTANDASIFRNFGSGEADVTAVDAKQRLFVTVPVNDDRKSNLKFCAEPSPDALSAISSSLSTSLSVGIIGQGEGAAGVASSLQEAVQKIGKRNATVQLFRDGWYRLCEGSVNGDIRKSTYTLLATKYADSTVVWLAIEELAGLTTSTAATTASGGTTASAQTTIGPSDPADPANADDQPPNPQTSASSEASAGAPSASASVISGRANPPSDVVAKATAVLVTEYLQRARFNDCLLALDSINIDLGLGGIVKNDAMEAVIDGCKDVIKNQATESTVLSDLLSGAQTSETQ